jgi:hypothetical protein
VFVVNDSGRVTLEEAPSLNNAAAVQSPQKLCVQFGCKQTHNEQIIVTPCGIILARKTFYGAEAVSSVAVCYAAIISNHVSTYNPISGNSSNVLSEWMIST